MPRPARPVHRGLQGPRAERQHGAYRYAHQSQAYAPVQSTTRKFLQIEFHPCWSSGTELPCTSQVLNHSCTRLCTTEGVNQGQPHHLRRLP